MARAIERSQLPAEGAVSGLIAGCILAAGETIYAAASGASGAAPWRMSASLLLGPVALQGTALVGTLVVGLVVHFALSAFFGAIWGAIASLLAPERRDDWAVHASAATVYGLVVYLVNFQVVAKLIVPRFLATNGVAQVLLHAFAFGLPLGLTMVARLRPVERRGFAGARA